ncbi:MAG: DUF3179 domain-containing (seleno)protein [Rhodospirillales bacterium]|jgi:hypothetical protein|nr:DUF3179 domain-containing (seleno)protein [Rhodospirillales bacterium]MDP7425756.1 DUF3179 domain-containing (seleno)protein [Rhodospirillales bacterium]|tara:strand:- start:1107 stop:2333 length:1227 start_codon:yes stop_codon:yes gene_type:complete
MNQMEASDSTLATEQAGMQKYITFDNTARASLVVALIVGVIGFVVLADLSQFVVEAPRNLTMKAFHWRFELITVGLFSAVYGYWVCRSRQLLSRRMLKWWLIAFIFLMVFGYFNATYMMFRTQHQTARFVPIENIVNAPTIEVRDTDEVFVVEINGDARAYPLDWITQPHIAGDMIGGKNVALTYCSLSHLGYAFTPKLGGKEVDLGVMTQLKNNLVMYDKNTNKPIQQIWGNFEGEKERMEMWPTRIMSFAAFRDLYPKGKVFHNPIHNPWDWFTRWMMFTVLDYQHVIEPPVFPTIDKYDERLPTKAYVYGLRVGDTKIAYTLDYIKRNGGIVNTEVGGKPIALVYYKDHDFVDAFERTVSGKIIEVKEVDEYGVSPHGKLKRVPMAVEIFWIIWHTFYPDTELIK